MTPPPAGAYAGHRRWRVGGRQAYAGAVDALRAAAHRAAGRDDRAVSTKRRLAEAERQLAEQRRTLAAEHALAARLQQIILPIPDGPLDLPGLRVALRYLPAVQEHFVGGDWYHAAELRDGSVLLAVGDVAGHGTPAATAMAQLRHALRALAVTTTDPGVLLGLLNRLTYDLDLEQPELCGTAVIARYRPRCPRGRPRPPPPRSPRRPATRPPAGWWRRSRPPPRPG